MTKEIDNSRKKQDDSFPENEGGEEKKDRLEKVGEVLGKPLYGNIALVIIQILIFALINAAILEPAWFIEERCKALIFIFFVSTICFGIYCIACKGSTTAFFLLALIFFVAFVSGWFDSLDLKGNVAYLVQLGLQSISLTIAMFASMEIKGHRGS